MFALVDDGAILKEDEKGNLEVKLEGISMAAKVDSSMFMGLIIRGLEYC